MAKRSRNRYREMESLMTKIILGDVLVFVLYLVSANQGWSVFKVITAIISTFGSLLCVGWLYLTGEFGRRRSLWMVTEFISIVICVAVSLLLSYPAPADAVAAAVGTTAASATTIATTAASGPVG